MMYVRVYVCVLRCVEKLAFCYHLFRGPVIRLHFNDASRFVITAMTIYVHWQKSFRVPRKLLLLSNGINNIHME